MEPDKEADIAVCDHDLYAMSTADIKNLKCKLTIFDGRVVYKDAATTITSRLTALIRLSWPSHFGPNVLIRGGGA